MHIARATGTVLSIVQCTRPSNKDKSRSVETETPSLLCLPNSVPGRGTVLAWEKDNVSLILSMLPFGLAVSCIELTEDYEDSTIR